MLQLKVRALEYLAELSKLGETEHRDNPALRQLFARLPDAWLNGEGCAAAGVAVATSQPSLPKKCFSAFPRHFPGFLSPRRLHGLLVALDDFPQFAKLVQEELWKGL
jgi:hypothetical protein